MTAANRPEPPLNYPKPRSLEYAVLDDHEHLMIAVRKATAEAAIASTVRDEAIRAAHQNGATTRAIAAEAGLSHQRIHQILHGR